MKKALSLILLVLFFSCSKENEEPDQQGITIFTSIALNGFIGQAPNGRLAANSTWSHIFQDEANLIIKNKSTNQQYTIKYNPNDFTTPYTISLPFGSYEFESIVSGDKYSSYLPYEVKGVFEVSNSITSVILQGTTDYGLVTVKNEFLEAVWIIDDGYKPLFYFSERKSYYVYVQKETNLKLEIIEHFNNSGFIKEFPIEAYVHYNFMLEMSNTDASFIELVITPFEVVDFTYQIGSNIVFDEEGNTYPTVSIGSNTWLKKSLRTKKFNNGDAIFQATTKEEWKHAFDNQIPAWAFFQFDSSTESVYGLAYNAFVILDERGIAPRGFTIPTIENFDNLVTLYGGVDIAATKLKSESLWGDGSNGTNISGFSANPSGYFNSDGGLFLNFGRNATFWSQTKSSDTGMYYVFISNQEWVTVSVRNFGMGQQIRAIRPN